MRIYGVVLSVLALSACAGQQIQCPLPKTVEVQVVKYQPVDPFLTQHQPIEQPSNRTCGEAVRVATVRKAAIEICNAHLDAIKQATTDVTP
jgi:hypothetical protein